MPNGTEITVDRQRLTHPGDARPQRDADARTPLADGSQTAKALYIHVPFCAHKCHYCDFYSFVDTRDRAPDFVAALAAELATIATHAGTLRSIFIGGGTPSLLPLDGWRTLLAAIHAHFRLADDAEWTVECNPESTTAELLALLAAEGINRVSLGAQSFDTRHLRTLERRHDPEHVRRALELAADAGIARRSIDLIYAVPGQTLGDWDRDLDAALALPIDHLSAYALTYEPNTAMTARRDAGAFQPATDEHEARLYRHAVARLGGAGFQRYEVSNFARPTPAGGPSRHNLAYWRSEPWLAAGPSASGHLNGHRWKNAPNLSAWAAGVRAAGGFAPIVDHEPPDAARAAAERAMMGIRLAEGLALDRLRDDAARFGRPAELERALDRARRAALLTIAGGRGTLTDDGFLHADGIAAELMDALTP